MERKSFFKNTFIYYTTIPLQYKCSDGTLYEGINPRGCYIDLVSESKTYKKVHHIGRMIREVDYQNTYRCKKGNEEIFFYLHG